MEEALGCQAFSDVSEVLLVEWHLGHHNSFPVGHAGWVVPYNLFLRDEDREAFRDLTAAQHRIADQPCNQYAADWEKGRQGAVHCQGPLT